jgi:hypothetical protein
MGEKSEGGIFNTKSAKKMKDTKKEFQKKRDFKRHEAEK